MCAGLSLVWCQYAALSLLFTWNCQPFPYFESGPQSGSRGDCIPVFLRGAEAMCSLGTNPLTFSPLKQWQRIHRGFTCVLRHYSVYLTGCNLPPIAAVKQSNLKFYRTPFYQSFSTICDSVDPYPLTSTYTVIWHTTIHTYKSVYATPIADYRLGIHVTLHSAFLHFMWTATFGRNKHVWMGRVFRNSHLHVDRA